MKQKVHYYIRNGGLKIRTIFLIAMLLYSCHIISANTLETGKETEKNAVGGSTSNEQVDGESFFISGMYIAGQGYYSPAGNMTSRGFKLRTNRNGNKAVFTVNFPYTIKKIVLTGTSNFDADNEQGISISKVEADGKDFSFSECMFPPRNRSKSASLNLDGINASDSIVIYFDNTYASQPQLNITYSVDWERPNASEPAIKMNSKTLALIPGEKYTLSAKVAPKTFNTMWYSDNEDVATVSNEGVVTAIKSGKANIIHAWSDNNQVADTTSLKVTDLGVLTPYIVKKYDFTSMGDIALSISQEAAGSFYVPGYYEYTPVYKCLNEDLNDIAIQEPLSTDGRIGWTIENGKGLYMGTSADRSAAIWNIKAGQIVEIVYTGEKFFVGTYDGEPSKITLNESKGRAIFQFTEDGYLGFGISRNSYIKSITIYEKKVLKLENISYLLPSKDLLYDGEEHGAEVDIVDGAGVMHIYYTDENGIKTEEKPVQAGTYKISFVFEESDLYYATEFEDLFTFTIYNLDLQEWNILSTFYSEQEDALINKWNIEAGVTGANKLYGVTYEKGHVTGLNLSGQNLTGTFPYSILSLPQLQYLNLSNNNLSGDIGTSAHDFALQHLDFVSSVKELNISDNIFCGNITTFTNLFPSLISLNASNNCLEDVSPVISSSVTTLDLSKQVISRVIPLHLANLSEDYISMNVPSILLYNHANQSFTKDIEMRCTTQDKKWEMTIKCQNGHFSIPYVSEQNTYYGQSGDILNVAIQNKNSANEISTFPIALSFDEGDSNFDGQVNVLDLQTTLNYMFEEYTNKPYNFTASNLWKDEVINVQDAVSLVNLLLNTDVQQTAYDYNLARLDIASPLATDASIYIINGELSVNSSVPISAFDIVVSTKQKCKIAEELSKAGFTCSVKQNGAQVHIVGYSLSGNELPVGQNVLCKLNDGFVTHAMMADKDANAISTSTYGTTTNILPTFSDTVSRKEVYRISLGYNHSIIIDANGKKFIVKNKH